jgi:hypothetical protein
LCVEVSTASAPERSALAGQRRVEAECGPPRLVDDERAPAAWATSAQPATSAASRSRSGETMNATRASARLGERRPSASGVTPWAMPSSSSYVGAT